MTSPPSDRPLPQWFDDAKLGVFLHWGLYSVPGWAPQVPDIQTQLKHHPPSYLFANSPYAEWYANTMRIKDSPTQVHHRETYGGATPYDSFAEPFCTDSSGADLVELASVCRAAGARYVVLTTKHHDGFCLWPTSVDHPVRTDDWYATRDLVGDLTDAVTAAGMRMGLYYSGGFDWSVHDVVIHDFASALEAIPQTPAYADYCDAHLRELINRYEPAVLWNDIAAPGPLDVGSLFDHYYERVPDGVVNDRWSQAKVRIGPATKALVKGASWLLELAWPLVPSRYKGLDFPLRPDRYDFTTPEYAQHDAIVSRKWESTRGVGHSFGANRNERPEDVLTGADLVRSFVDVVAKGGNLLIGIGPEPNGSIPEWQQAPLRGLGDWLGANGHAIFGSRPFTIASGRTGAGSDVRFTRTDDAVHAVVLETPPTREVSLPDIDAGSVTGIQVAGLEDEAFSWQVEGTTLRVRLPDRLPVSPALVISMQPASAVRPVENPVGSAG